MAKKKIFITATGDVVALHDESFAKMADVIGAKEIHRVSEVEFNNIRQVWEVKCPAACKLHAGHNPPISEWIVVAEDATRAGALAKEKTLIENVYREMLKDGEGKLFIHSDSGCAPRLEALQST